MRTFIQGGEMLDLTAPSGGVASGQGYVVGTLFVVASTTGAAGTKFAGKTEGVFQLAKLSTAVFAEGDAVFWDNTNKRVATTASGLFKIGAAVAAYGNGTTSAQVRLDGIAVTAVP